MLTTTPNASVEKDLEGGCLLQDQRVQDQRVQDKPMHGKQGTSSLKARLMGMGAGLGLLAAALLGAPACGGSEVDFDLSQIAEVSGSGPLTWVRPSGDNLFCVRAPCPSVILHEVNTGATRFVYMLDWRAMHLAEADQQAIERSTSGLLLEGHLTNVTVLNQPTQIFQVTRANQHITDKSTDRPESDRYYRVQTSDVECMQPPCGGDWKATLLLTGAQPEHWKTINLGALQLPPAEEQALIEELKTGQDYLSVREVGDQTAQATQVFRPIARMTGKPML